eukprot:m.235034 g.235034  ORF g.235034 m.235034 type:complete len:422 (-) comp19867_c0_seq1:138-1403(-)
MAQQIQQQQQQENRQQQQQLTPQELQLRLKYLRKCALFTQCSDDFLVPLAGKMTERIFKQGDVVLAQGLPHRNIYFLVEGEVLRLRIDNEGVVRWMEPPSKDERVFGALHVLSANPALATLHCETTVRAFELSGETVRDAFTNAEFSRQVARSLCTDILQSAGKYRTPMLEQHSRKINFLATTVAAAIESFYRSALNSLLNRRLTGTKGPLFPDMHIQIVTRMVYINGLKGMRRYFETHYDADTHHHPATTRFLLACAPGLVMCPVSSVLEATNAHLNPEPVHIKWIRGYLPRCVREVIFAVGLNQMSDYWSERIPEKMVPSSALRAAGGSLLAGVVSGYLSHVPHNLATMKLMSPTRSYGQLFREFAARSETRLPAAVPVAARPFAASLLSVLAPVGVHIRTTQIVGSFALLNGFIAALS